MRNFRRHRISDPRFGDRAYAGALLAASEPPSNDLGTPQISKHRTDIAHLEGVGVGMVASSRLNPHLLDGAVVYEHGVAPGTMTKAHIRLIDQHAHLAGELAVTVGQQEDVLVTLFLAHLNMTNASLTEMQIISSTPWALNASYNSS